MLPRAPYTSPYERVFVAFLIKLDDNKCAHTYIFLFSIFLSSYDLFSLVRVSFLLLLLLFVVQTATSYDLNLIAIAIAECMYTSNVIFRVSVRQMRKWAQSCLFVPCKIWNAQCASIPFLHNSIVIFQKTLMHAVPRTYKTEADAT